MTCTGVEARLHTLLICSLHGDMWLDSYPGLIISKKMTPPFAHKLILPQSPSACHNEGKLSQHFGSRLLVLQLAVSYNTDWAIPAPNWLVSKGRLQRGDKTISCSINLEQFGNCQRFKKVTLSWSKVGIRQWSDPWAIPWRYWLSVMSDVRSRGYKSRQRTWCVRYEGRCLLRPRNIDFFQLRCLLAETVRSRPYSVRARSGAVGSGSALQAGRPRFLFPLRLLDFS